jgi:hypothetical protein
LARSPTIWKGHNGSLLPASEAAGVLYPQLVAAGATATATATAAGELGPLAVLQSGQIDLVNRAHVLTGPTVYDPVPFAIEGEQTVGASTGRDPVPALGAADAVLAPRSLEPVAALATDKPIPALGALEQVAPGASLDPVVAPLGR